MYRRRASPLHAARAGAGAAYCLALGAAALSVQHPLVLAVLGLSAIGAGAAAGVLPALARTLRFTVPLALVSALVNALVVRQGLTVVARFGEVPPFGQIDVTSEALVYGLVFLGLRIVVVTLWGALLSLAVDPDALLRGFRRISYRSALSASLATRLYPVLMRDAARMSEAQRCRPEPAPRTAVLRAVATGALDRSLDVAATLEVRGYSVARPGPRARRRWSRHDLAFAAAACAGVALAVWARAAAIAAFDPYPLLHLHVGMQELGLAGAFVLVALVPFADRRGIEP